MDLDLLHRSVQYQLSTNSASLVSTDSQKAQLEHPEMSVCELFYTNWIHCERWEIRNSRLYFKKIIETFHEIEDVINYSVKAGKHFDRETAQQSSTPELNDIYKFQGNARQDIVYSSINCNSL